MNKLSVHLAASVGILLLGVCLGGFGYLLFTGDDEDPGREDNLYCECIHKMQLNNPNSGLAVQTGERSSIAFQVNNGCRELSLDPENVSKTQAEALNRLLYTLQENEKRSAGLYVCEGTSGISHQITLSKWHTVYPVRVPLDSE